MTEKYGVQARLVESLASTPVDTSTNIVFIGAAPIENVDGYATRDLVHRPIHITSMSDYAKKLGGAVGDGYSLSEAAEACFAVVGISGAYFINVHNPDDSEEDLTTDDVYIGSASEKTGIYAIQKLHPLYGVVCNLACCPGRTSGDIVSALKTNVTKTNGHWDGMAVFDVIQTDEQAPNSIVDVSKVVNDNKFENGIAVWPSVKTMAGNTISGAAVVCALYARNDGLRNDIPVRSIGNTNVSIVGACLRSDTTQTPILMEEAEATEIQQNGIITFLNVGGGTYQTWGDHTSLVTNGTVADERARFDSTIRVLYMLMNRFQQKYGFTIDSPMTLTMRNDVIQEENDYLAYLQSVGAIIGDATCVFKRDDNTPDGIAQGQFVWSIEATITPPLKYAQLNVAYSQAGLSVYYE